jgi:CheY-like chemotaxis protein
MPTLLLIDDDADDANLFQQVVQRTNVPLTLRIELDCVEALQYLAATDNPLPDVIFLDLNMPKLNGSEILAVIKTDPRTKHIPVVIYTTSRHERDIKQVGLLGAMAYIVKPNHMEGLKKIIHATVNGLQGELEHYLASNAGPDLFIKIY